MVLCLVAIAFQTATPSIAIHRAFKRKEVQVYAVSVDSEGEAGKAHYDYEMRFSADRVVAESKTTQITNSFVNLRGRIGDQELPKRRAFGVATYQFPETGFPSDYSFGGQDASFVIPVLSWLLPTEAIPVGGSFEVPDKVYDGFVHMKGSGSLVDATAAKATIKLALAFGVPPAKGGRQAVAQSYFSSVATFNLKNGALESSEGSMTGPSGSLNFKIRRV
ncbi:MAG: hypothetical protein P4L46_15305 [Fimbriimonas sp.]|nr:hypothetical protein [Fimbriimonas sp.]